MKRTLNVNIGSIAFILEEDAYYMLKNYLSELSVRIEPALRAETMNDVEMRIADILSEILVSTRQVVTVEHIKRVISIIGSAEDFGDGGAKSGYDPAASESDKKTDGSESAEGRKRLLRSKTDKTIGGVCGGMAEYFNIDSTLIRIIAFVSLLCSFGTALFVYLAMWIIIPSE